MFGWGFYPALYGASLYAAVSNSNAYNTQLATIQSQLNQIQQNQDNQDKQATNDQIQFLNNEINKLKESSAEYTKSGSIPAKYKKAPDAPKEASNNRESDMNDDNWLNSNDN